MFQVSIFVSIDSMFKSFIGNVSMLHKFRLFVRFFFFIYSK